MAASPLVCHNCWAVQHGVNPHKLHVAGPEHDAVLTHMKQMPASYTCVICEAEITNTAAQDKAGVERSLLNLIGSVLGMDVQVVDMREQDADDQDETDVISAQPGMPAHLVCHSCWHEWSGEDDCGENANACGYIAYGATLPEGILVCGECGGMFPHLHETTMSWVMYSYRDADIARERGPDRLAFMRNLAQERMTVRMN